MKNLVSGACVALGLIIQAFIGFNAFAMILVGWGLLMFEYTPQKWKDAEYRFKELEIQLLEQKLKRK